MTKQQILDGFSIRDLLVISREARRAEKARMDAEKKARR